MFTETYDRRTPLSSVFLVLLVVPLVYSRRFRYDGGEVSLSPSTPYFLKNPKFLYEHVVDVYSVTFSCRNFAL